jgi:hypothetical protein
VERTTTARETEVLGENLPQRHVVPPQIPHDQVRFRTPARSGGKPATNRLSYGAAYAPLVGCVAILEPHLPVSGRTNMSNGKEMRDKGGKEINVRKE